jgi:hypothetical protein
MAAASGVDPALFLRDYEQRLHQLQRPEKRDITALTVLAGDHRQHAHAVVAAVLRHIQVVRVARVR